MTRARHGDQALGPYHRKRDFRATTEPRGRTRRGASTWAFVVHEHAARRLHYDLRLEVDGILRSWAVPKGVPTVPGEKRLAVQTEDHPMSYLAFEGTIAPGQYGAGTVAIWDRGRWSVEGDARRGLEKGHLTFSLEGQKLRGRFSLVRMHPPADAKPSAKVEWLLLRHEDPFPDLGILSPALATVVGTPPEGSWLFEIKYDGYRALAGIDAGRVHIVSRNGRDWTARVPDIAAALGTIRVRSAIFDGEIVWLDAHGKSDFQSLQAALSGRAPEEGRLVYVVFDLLYRDGRDLRRDALSERKKQLREILADVPLPLQYGAHHLGDGLAFAREARAHGAEGIMAKRPESTYPGGRSRDWLKIKFTARQEFVIVGFTPSRAQRRGLGALLLAVHEGDALRYAGKVGTGLSDRVLGALGERLAGLTEGARAPRNAPSDDRAVWTRPEIVCEVRFSEWTREGLLRHPTFVGIREDKSPRDVVRETTSQALSATRLPSHEELTSRPSGNVVLGVRITHGDRVVDPQSQTTKLEVARYHEQISSNFIKFATGRPLLVVRCAREIESASRKLPPRGRASPCFVQRRAGRGLLDPDAPPKLVGDVPALIVDSPPDVLRLVQGNVIELHGSGARWPNIDLPDAVTFDLDPDDALPFAPVVDAAFELRDNLQGIGLQSFVKTTGGKGLHVVVPLRPRDGWATIRAFAAWVAETFATSAPSRYVATMTRAKRTGKIFIDHFRNAPGATAVLPYSPRATPELPVALPIAWADLRHVHPADFTLRTVPDLVARRRRDPWEQMWTSKQLLGPSLRRWLVEREPPSSK